MFELMFCLIGINGVDLAKARDKDVCKGRLNYKRTKTGKNYSIKVEEEALIIINRYKGKDGNLVNVMDRESSRKNKDYNYHSYFNWMAKTLRNLDGGTLVPHICSGSARTSWATIAQEELDIPREVIAAALGHHTVDVTSTYLRTDWKNKVDEANRKVLDWVLYQKKKGRKK